jgi:hypothetical protein
MTFENAVIPETLHELSRMIMQALPEIIKKKEATLKFANVSDLMFHYIQGDLGQDKKFIYYLEKIADDQLTVLEEFNTLNSSKLLWGYGKFVNKNIAPGFAQQISSSIMNRSEFAKTPSVNHRLHKKIVS